MTSHHTHLHDAASKLVQATTGRPDGALTDALTGIVKTHAAVAIAGAFVPVPGLDLAALAANAWTMYVRLNAEAKLPFEKNMVKSIATGVVTNLGSNVVGVLAVSTVVKFVPGLGSIGGGMLLAATMYGVTLAAGIVYMRALAKLKSWQDDWTGVTPQDVEQAVHREMQDKQAMKDIIEDGKQYYKANKDNINKQRQEDRAPTPPPPPPRKKPEEPNPYDELFK